MAVVVIHDEVLMAMSLPGGQIWKYGLQRRRMVERLAKGICPKRTNHLATSIEGHWEPDAPYECTMIVSAGAGYALYVHEGTEGPIHAKAGRLLKLPGSPGPGFRYYSDPQTRMAAAEHRALGGKIYKAEVRGQFSQPFLKAALEAVMTTKL